MANHKVVWKDGMFILPHHFQQMEQFLLTTTQQAVAQTTPFPYGLSAYRVNSTILADGVFQLDNASGVFPDGTPFSLQIGEELPAPRKVDDYITDPTKPLLVYIAIPSYWAGRAAYTDTASVSEGRYVRSFVSTADEETGVSREDIEVARLNVVTLFEGESLEGYSAMPIARVRKLVTGAVEVDDLYVPPLLKISGSLTVMDTARSIISALRIRGSELMRARKEISSNLAEFPPEEVTSLTMLHTITTNLPLLEQYIGIAREVSPFTLNTILGQLAGSLSVFKPGNDILTLPPYDHENVATVFASYREIIESLIAGDYSPNSMLVDFRKTGQVTFECPLDDSIDLLSSDLYIGIKADIAEGDLNRAVEGLMKVSSQALLPRLTMSAMPGLQITAVHNPGQKLATKEGYLYYAISKSGEHWDSIVADSTLAVYFPGHFENLSMQLLATKSEG